MKNMQIESRRFPKDSSDAFRVKQATVGMTHAKAFGPSLPNQEDDRFTQTNIHAKQHTVAMKRGYLTTGTITISITDRENRDEVTLFLSPSQAAELKALL